MKRTLLFLFSLLALLVPLDVGAQGFSVALYSPDYETWLQPDENGAITTPLQADETYLLECQVDSSSFVNADSDDNQVIIWGGPDYSDEIRCPIKRDEFWAGIGFNSVYNFHIPSNLETGHYLIEIPYGIFYNTVNEEEKNDPCYYEVDILGGNGSEDNTTDFFFYPYLGKEGDQIQLGSATASEGTIKTDALKGIYLKLPGDYTSKGVVASAGLVKYQATLSGGSLGFMGESIDLEVADNDGYLIKLPDTIWRGDYTLSLPEGAIVATIDGTEKKSPALTVTINFNPPFSWTKDKVTFDSTPHQGTIESLGRTINLKPNFSGFSSNPSYNLGENPSVSVIGPDGNNIGVSRFYTEWTEAYPIIINLDDYESLKGTYKVTINPGAVVIDGVGNPTGIDFNYTVVGNPFDTYQTTPNYKTPISKEDLTSSNTEIVIYFDYLTTVDWSSKQITINGTQKEIVTDFSNNPSTSWDSSLGLNGYKLAYGNTLSTIEPVNGKYTFVIPKEALSAQFNGEKVHPENDIEFSYELPMNYFEKVEFTPADGAEMSALSGDISVKVTSSNDEVMTANDLGDASAIGFTGPEGAITGGISSVDWNETTQSVVITLSGEYKTVGDYTITLPAGFFKVEGQPSLAQTVTYTVAADPWDAMTWELVNQSTFKPSELVNAITMKAGGKKIDVVDKSKISITSNPARSLHIGNVQWVYGSYNCLGVMIDGSDSPIKATDYGTYTVTFDDEALKIGNWSNDKFEITWTVKKPAFSEAAYEPAQSKEGESLWPVPAEITVTFANAEGETVHVDGKASLTRDGETVSEEVTITEGEGSVSIATEDLMTEEGKYEFTIPAGVLSVGEGSDLESNPNAITITYNVEKPDYFANREWTPDTETTDIYELPETVSVSFTDREEFTPVIVTNEITVTKDGGEPQTIEGAMSLGENDEIVISTTGFGAKNETGDTEYAIEIPAGALKINGKASTAIEYTLTVSEELYFKEGADEWEPADGESFLKELPGTLTVKFTKSQGKAITVESNVVTVNTRTVEGAITGGDGEISISTAGFGAANADGKYEISIAPRALVIKGETEDADQWCEYAPSAEYTVILPVDADYTITQVNDGIKNIPAGANGEFEPVVEVKYIYVKTNIKGTADYVNNTYIFPVDIDYNKVEGIKMVCDGKEYEAENVFVALLDDSKQSGSTNPAINPLTLRIEFYKVTANGKYSLELPEGLLVQKEGNKLPSAAKQFDDFIEVADNYLVNCKFIRPAEYIEYGKSLKDFVVSFPDLEEYYKTEGHLEATADPGTAESPNITISGTSVKVDPESVDVNGKGELVFSLSEEVSYPAKYTVTIAANTVTCGSMGNGEIKSTFEILPDYFAGAQFVDSDKKYVDANEEKPFSGAEIVGESIGNFHVMFGTSDYNSNFRLVKAEKENGELQSDLEASQAAGAKIKFQKKGEDGNYADIDAGTATASFSYENALVNTRRFRIHLESPIATPGEYKVIVPAGTVYYAIPIPGTYPQEYINQSLCPQNPEVSAEFTIKPDYFAEARFQSPSGTVQEAEEYVINFPGFEGYTEKFKPEISEEFYQGLAVTGNGQTYRAVEGSAEFVGTELHFRTQKLIHAGEYTVTVPAGFITIDGESGPGKDKLTLRFTIEQQAFPAIEANFEADAYVRDVKDIVLTFKEAVRLTGKEETYVSVNGENVTEGVVLDEEGLAMTIPYEKTTYGTVEVKVPAGMLTVGNGATLNGDETFSCTVVPEFMAAPTLVPAEGSVTADLNRLVVRYAGLELADLDEERMATITVKDKAGTVAYNGRPSKFAENSVSSVDILLADENGEPVTEFADGEYVLTIPAGVFVDKSTVELPLQTYNDDIVAEYQVEKPSAFFEGPVWEPLADTEDTYTTLPEVRISFPAREGEDADHVKYSYDVVPGTAKPTLSKDGGQAKEVAFEIVDNVLVIKTAANAPGTYVLTVPKATVTIEGVENTRLTGTYEIKKPDYFKDAAFTVPAPGEVAEVAATLEVSFPSRAGFMPEFVGEAEAITVRRGSEPPVAAKGAEVDADGKLVITLEEAITFGGTYTVTVPEKTVSIDDLLNAEPITGTYEIEKADYFAGSELTVLLPAGQTAIYGLKDFEISFPNAPEGYKPRLADNAASMIGVKAVGVSNAQTYRPSTVDIDEKGNLVFSLSEELTTAVASRFDVTVGAGLVTIDGEPSPGYSERYTVKERTDEQWWSALALVPAGGATAETAAVVETVGSFNITRPDNAELGVVSKKATMTDMNTDKSFEATDLSYWMVSFEETKEPGLYRVAIPAGAFSYSGKGESPAFEFYYLIKEFTAEDFWSGPTPSPAEGEVPELSTIGLSFPQAYKGECKILPVEDVEITVTDKDGKTVTTGKGLALSDGSFGGFQLEQEIIMPGEYTVTIPEGALKASEAKYGEFGGMTLSYSIAEFTVDAEIFAETRLTSDDGYETFKSVRVVIPYLERDTAAKLAVMGDKKDLKVVAPTGENIACDELYPYSAGLLLNFPESTALGEYTLRIPEGFLRIGTSVNPVLELVFTCETTKPVDLEPTLQVVEANDDVLEGDALMAATSVSAVNLLTDKAVTNSKEWTSLIRASYLTDGEKQHAFSDMRQTGGVWQLVLAQPITEPGSYSLYIPEGLLTVDKRPNAEISVADFVTIVDPTDYFTDEAITLPAEGAEAESFNSFEVTFPGLKEEYMSEENKPVLTKNPVSYLEIKKGEEVLADAIDANSVKLESNVLSFNTKEPIILGGTYTLTVKEGLVSFGRQQSGTMTRVFTVNQLDFPETSVLPEGTVAEGSDVQYMYSLDDVTVNFATPVKTVDQTESGRNKVEVKVNDETVEATLDQAGRNLVIPVDKSELGAVSIEIPEDVLTVGVGASKNEAINLEYYVVPHYMGYVVSPDEGEPIAGLDNMTIEFPYELSELTLDKLRQIKVDCVIESENGPVEATYFGTLSKFYEPEGAVAADKKIVDVKFGNFDGSESVDLFQVGTYKVTVAPGTFTDARTADLGLQTVNDEIVVNYEIKTISQYFAGATWNPAKGTQAKPTTAASFKDNIVITFPGRTGVDAEGNDYDYPVVLNEENTVPVEINDVAVEGVTVNADNQLVIPFDVNTPGTYKVEIPENFVTIHSIGNVSAISYYKVEKPAYFEGATVAPAAGAVKSLKEFTVTFPKGNGFAPEVNKDANITVTRAKGTPVVAKAAPNADGQLVITLDEEITLGGSYTLNIPQGAVSIDELKNPAAITAVYSIAKSDYFAGANVASPEAGIVETLKVFTVEFPGKLGFKPEVKAAANIKLTDAEGKTVTSLTTSLDADNNLVITAASEVKNPGVYTLSVEAGAVSIDDVLNAAAITAEYEIEVKTDAAWWQRAIVTPAGSTLRTEPAGVEELETMTVSFPGATTILAEDEVITLENLDAADEAQSVAPVLTGGEYALRFQLTDNQGDYALTIPAATFFSEDAGKNPEMTWYYHIDAISNAEFWTAEFTPADGDEDLKSIQRIDVSFPNKRGDIQLGAGTQITLSGEDGTTVNGTANISGSSIWFQLEKAVTEPGKYTVNIPAGVLVAQRTKYGESPAFNLSYEISPLPIDEAAFAGAYLEETSGATLGYVRVILPNKGQYGIYANGEASEIVAKGPEGASVAAIYAGGYSQGLSLSFPETTTFGEYEITIPEGYLALCELNEYYSADPSKKVALNPEFSVKFTVEEPAPLEVDYTFGVVDANGTTVASAEATELEGVKSVIIYTDATSIGWGAWRDLLPEAYVTDGTETYGFSTIAGVGNTAYRLDLTETLTAPGTYSLYVPEGIITIDNRLAPEVNGANIFTIKAEDEPTFDPTFWEDVTFDPADGETVKSISTVAAYFAGDVTKGEDPVITLKNETTEGELTPTNIYVMPGGEVMIQFAETAVAGEYTLTIGAGSFTSVKGGDSPEFKLSYTIEETEPSEYWEAQWTPAEGSTVASIENGTVSVVFPNSDEWVGEGDVIYRASLVNETTGTTYEYWYSDLNNMNDGGYIEFNQGKDITEPGEYVLTVPAGSWYSIYNVAEDSPEFTVSFTIEGQPAPSLDGMLDKYEADPADGESISKFSTPIKVTFPDLGDEYGIYLADTPVVKLTDELGNEYTAALDAVDYQGEAMAATALSIEVKAEEYPAGVYTFVIPAGTVHLCSRDDFEAEYNVVNPEIKLTYHVTEGVGIFSILDEAETYTVVDYAGRVIVREGTAQDVLDLNPGFYIINGKRVNIRK